MSAAPQPTRDPRLHACLFEPLARLRRRLRLYLALEGLLPVVAAVLSISTAQLALDRWLHLSIDQRAVLNVLITLVWTYILFRTLLRRLLRPLDDAELANLVDRHRPDLADRLATGVQFAQGRVGDRASNSPQLVSAVIEQACDAATRIRFLDVLDHRRARQRITLLSVVFVVIAGAFVIERELMWTWFARNWLVQDLDWPQQTHIEPVGFVDGVLHHPLGEPLEIEARIAGVPPRRTELQWWRADGQRGVVNMSRVGPTGLTATLGGVAETLSFRIVGGDEQTPAYHVQVVERPRVARVTAQITPPAYTQTPPYTLDQQTAFEVLRGSSLTLDVHLSKSVDDVALVGLEDPPPLERPAPDQLRVNWPEAVAGSIQFALRDRYGFENLRPVRLNIRVTPDAPPTAQLEAGAVGDLVTPAAVLPLQMRCEDTYGLAAARVEAQRGDDPPLALVLPGMSAGLRAVTQALEFEVNAVGADVGDTVRLSAVAVDFDPHGPNITRSAPVTLRVVSRQEMADELSQRELELRREFEQLISAQRGLRDALSRLAPAPAGDAAAVTGVSQQLVALGRRQAWHASRCLALARDFEQVLGQMQINRMARAADQQRLAGRIIDPLGALGRGAMPGAVAALSAAGARPAELTLTPLLADQDDLLAQMDTILAAMLEWEGYREAVKLLETVIDGQSEAHDATVDRIADELGDILEFIEPVAAPDDESP